MKVEQISVFLENRAGRLLAVTRLLGEHGINIRALSLADTSDFGILRLIVDQPGAARNALDEAGFTLSVTSVIAVDVPDEPGGLAGVLERLHAHGINVEYMYAFVERTTGKAVLIFRFEEPEQAMAILREAGLRILSGEEVMRL